MPSRKHGTRKGPRKSKIRPAERCAPPLQLQQQNGVDTQVDTPVEPSPSAILTDEWAVVRRRTAIAYFYFVHILWIFFTVCFFIKICEICIQMFIPMEDEYDDYFDWSDILTQTPRNKLL